MKNLCIAALAVVAMSSMVMAEGLEVGESVSAFYVKDVTGPKAGEKLCYRCNYGNRPVVSIFTRQMNDNVASLVKKVDAKVDENEAKKMAAFVVLLTDQPEAKEAELKAVASKQGIKKTPLTTFDGPAGPPTYKIAKDAEVTVMMWVGGTLTVNEQLKASDLSEAKINSIVNQTKSILN